MLECGDKIIDGFKNSTFSSEHLKKSVDAAHDHVLEDVNNFIQKIESIAEKTNLGLFEEFLNHYHQLIMQKPLLILRIQMKKKFVAQIKDRISNLKDRIKEMIETEKK